MHNQTNCYCQSGSSFVSCCQPYILGKQNPTTAEQLMRSRYSAYAIGNYTYILQTYGKKQRDAISVDELAKSSINTKWLALQVVQYLTKDTTAQVEFKAYYQVDSVYYLMHELSNFERVDNRWFYTTGNILKGSGQYKQERNDICLCGSGRKFKKCCGK
ncbi:YchJ family protein [Paraglaciecola aquimarina]|uniref:YchJ family protein n=1 Tax=Paraglaciecola aquimarina TaxID=1235557 RepID=A0ABU3SZF9_9ALTE|nr:YchJ family protein [Paraglaciecola aquimarina]MDU0355302.1 YchJ family protein [Paraglaciecola aquimarina]